MDADGEAVLQFLLGKTSTMPLEDTRSVASTSSSQASDATSAASGSSSGGFKDEDAPKVKEVDDAVGAEGDENGHPLELQPICENESELEQEEKEEEEEVGTDHESTDDEREGEQAAEEKDETLSEEGDWGKNDDEERDLPVETTAGTESEVEDEDGCGHTDERNEQATRESPVVCDPLQSEAFDDEDVDVVKSSDTRAASSSAEVDSDTTQKTEAATATPDKPSDEPSLGQLALVSVVAIVLLAYVIACAYSFLYRDTSGAVVLPDVSLFEHPIDVKNTSVRIISPSNHSTISAPLLRLDWQLENFPADALRAGGPEVFQYDVLVNDKRVKLEVVMLELTPSEKENERVHALNRSMTQHIRWETLDASAETFTVHIDVQVPVPGSYNQVATFSQSLVLVNGQKMLETAGEDDTGVLIKTPEDGARMQQGEDLVLTYAVGPGVKRLRVEINGTFAAWKTHVDDGVLLLHGLAEGAHEITLTAVGQSDSDVASSASVSVHIGTS